jgi:hypothetical protein
MQARLRRNEMRSNSFLFWILALGFSGESRADQTLKREDVPDRVLAAVDHRYAGTKQLRWEKENEQGKIQFEVILEDGKEVSLASDGKILSEESEVPYASVPEIVRKAYAAGRYAAWKIVKAEKIVDGEDPERVAYELTASQGRKGVEIVFDGKGKAVKTERYRAKPDAPREMP